MFEKGLNLPYQVTNIFDIVVSIQIDGPIIKNDKPKTQNFISKTEIELSPTGDRNGQTC